MNIPEVVNEFKRSLQRVPEDVVVVCIVVFVGMASFALGRLSVDGQRATDVRICTVPAEQVSVEAPRAQLESQKDVAAAAQSVASGEVVASKNGTKYHLPWCSGAKRIAAVNKVTFASAADAELAGYTAAANCPGL